MFFKLKKTYIVLFLMIGVVAALVFSNYLGATTKKIKESIDTKFQVMPMIMIQQV
ncbi:hypothetical protein KKG61_01705 [bacterium]|nr:hypothetical protein [bacterium]